MVGREIASDPSPRFPNPPFSDELLADLHAGNLDPELAARLWPVVRADPAARRTIESLDEVTSLLGARGRDLESGATVPDWVRDKLDAAVAAPDRRKGRSPYVLVVLAAAAAVVVVAAVIGIGMAPADPGPAQADGTSGGIEGSMVSDAIGRFDDGRLNDPQTLRDCLNANGIDLQTKLLGASQVTIDGRGATLLIFPGPSAPELTALAVGDKCGAGSPDTVSRTDIG